MLACRAPYFATMLFGGFGSILPDNTVPLECCDSSTFKHILEFIFQGEICFLGMSMKALLDLLETSRFFCIELLQEGILDYLTSLINEKKVGFQDCLIAFEFANHHKFKQASDLFLNSIDTNLTIISTIPEFDSLSESSLKMILGNKERVSTEIERFVALAKWIKDKDISESDRSEIVGLFDLSKFDRKDLIEIVMKTNLFDDKEISAILEVHLKNLEEKINSCYRNIEAQKELN